MNRSTINLLILAYTHLYVDFLGIGLLSLFILTNIRDYSFKNFLLLLFKLTSLAAPPLNR